MKREPIFIGGLAYSGKTPLRLILSAHPHLALTRRTYMWTRFYNRFGDLAHRDNFERCLKAMMTHKEVRGLESDPSLIRKRFYQGERTYARLFALFHERHAERLGKSRWGDQLGFVERFADPIMTSYPDAKMIHIIRDPRDSFASRLNHPSHGQISVVTGAAIWLWSARLAESNRRKYPDRYRIIRYESLVEEPEACLQELCDFLGVVFSPEMLMIDQRVGDASEAGIQDIERVPRQIWNTSVGRFRNALSAREIAFLQQVGKNKMDLFDYALDPPGLSWPSMPLFYLFDYPSKMALMMLWYTKERMHILLGKAPADRRLKPSQDIVGIGSGWSLNS